MLTRNPIAAVLAALGIAAGSLNLAVAVAAERGDSPNDRLQPPAQVRPTAVESKSKLDRSGRKRIGKASFYARTFAGRKMADGTPMRLDGNNAASKTLPLGTTAKVTNLKTGASAVVTIRDRGPLEGRIVDLSPATASAIGLDPKTGVAQVSVAPIAVPLPNGEPRLGAGALEGSTLVDQNRR